MNPLDHRSRLVRATREAQARCDKDRVEAEQGEGWSPRPGDVLAFTATAQHSILWVILEEDRTRGPGFLLVAADLHPLVGSSDVAVSREASFGALCLRCSFEVQLPATNLGVAQYVGRLESGDLDQALRKWAQLEAGALRGTVLERDTDGDPEYLDWLEEGPAQAREALLTSLSLVNVETTNVDGFAEDRIYANGIDAVTGEYLTSALDSAQVAAWARTEKIDPSVLSLLRHVHRVSTQPHLGLAAGVDPKDIGQAGWAVVLHADESRAVRDALQPLIEHRQAVIGARKVGVLDYRSGESWRQWLSRHGVAAGQVDPARVPYYLMLVGSPALIPYDFQQVLGVEYAVGRLSLETADEVSRYAQSVVDHETREQAALSKTAVFFGPRHGSDPATRRSADLLVKPLMDGLRAEGGEAARSSVAARRGFGTRKLWGEAATKANLKATLHPSSGARPPALFFGAGHGLGWPTDHPRRLALQGALLCQDWPAPGRVDPDSHCFGAVDLADDARVHGTVFFFHASNSVGTPERASISSGSAASPPRSAREPFVAALTRRLLAHPGGGAAAVIGLVGRAWSFPSELAAIEQIQPFQSALEGILSGWPVGHSVRDFKKRYAELATELGAMRQKFAMGGHLDDTEVAAVWSEGNDARSIVVAGDPAARLRVEAMY